jgi:hypothetical protein
MLPLITGGAKAFQGEAMFRKCAIALSIMLLAFTTACSAKGWSASSSSGAGAGGVPAYAAASTARCPAHNTRSFAKARFVLDAGAAAGAFKKWIYSPYERGAFKEGANGRSKAIARAGVAGAFVVSRLLAAKASAQGNPALCRVAVAPITKLANSVKGLVARSKSCDLTVGDVRASDGGFGQFQSSASSAGAPYRERDTSIPGLG